MLNTKVKGHISLSYFFSGSYKFTSFFSGLSLGQVLVCASWINAKQIMLYTILISSVCFYSNKIISFLYLITLLALSFVSTMLFGLDQHHLSSSFISIVHIKWCSDCLLLFEFEETTNLFSRCCLQKGSIFSSSQTRLNPVSQVWANSNIFEILGKLVSNIRPNY